MASNTLLHMFVLSNILKKQVNINVIHRIAFGEKIVDRLMKIVSELISTETFGMNGRLQHMEHRYVVQIFV